MCCCCCCNLVPFGTYNIHTYILYRDPHSNTYCAQCRQQVFLVATLGTTHICLPYPKYLKFSSTYEALTYSLACYLGYACMLLASVCVCVCVLCLLPWQHLCKSQRPNEILRFGLNYVIKLCLIWHATHFLRKTLGKFSTFANGVVSTPQQFWPQK